jgi:hypothetical protein
MLSPMIVPLAVETFFKPGRSQVCRSRLSICELLGSSYK